MMVRSEAKFFRPVSYELQHIQFTKFCRGRRAGGVLSRDQQSSHKAASYLFRHIQKQKPNDVILCSLGTNFSKYLERKRQRFTPAPSASLRIEEFRKIISLTLA